MYAVLIAEFPMPCHAVTPDESSCEHLRYVIKLWPAMGRYPFLQRIVVVAPGEDSVKNDSQGEGGERRDGRKKEETNMRYSKKKQEDKNITVRRGDEKAENSSSTPSTSRENNHGTLSSMACFSQRKEKRNWNGVFC